MPTPNQICPQRCLNSCHTSRNGKGWAHSLVGRQFVSRPRLSSRSRERARPKAAARLGLPADFGDSRIRQR